MEYDSEEEQIAAIKRWLRVNGIPVVLAIVVVVAAFIGWRSWQGHKQSVAANASAVYQQMQAGLQQTVMPGNVDAMKQVQAAADELITSWPSSAYADYAHLALAKQAVVRADYDQAAAQLQQVVDKPATKALGYTATLRLARVYYQADKLDAAKKLVVAAFPQAWQGPALELKGDILVAQKQADDAKKAYNAAVSAYGKSAVAVQRLQMKLNQLKATS